MFVLRVNSNEMKALEVIIDNYLFLHDLAKVNDLKDKVVSAEFYDDHDFSIVSNKLFEDPD